MTFEKLDARLDFWDPALPLLFKEPVFDSVLLQVPKERTDNGRPADGRRTVSDRPSAHLRGRATISCVYSYLRSISAYDQADRLTAYGTGATYAYNGDGLRMSKTVGSSTSQFLWDVSSATPPLLKDGATAYVYGPGSLPLEQVSGSSVSWLHHDQLGSTRMVTNSSGSNVATYAYDSYGNVTATTGTITNPLRFAGQYADSESGLYYLRARYYDPLTAQLLARNPVMAITQASYAYASNNPLNRVDPRGLYDYQYDQYVGTVGETGGATATMTYLKANLVKTFPFSTGNCESVQEGATCVLQPLPFDAVPSKVTITDVQSQSFSFTSGAGHVAGPGGTITFSTYEKDGAVYLREVAHAPNASWWENIVDPPGAHWNWDHLASNLRQGLVPCSPTGYGILIL